MGRVVRLTAFKYEVSVRKHGKVDLTVPIAIGARVVIFVIPGKADAFADQTEAAASSLGFWNNPYDDEDWNNVRSLPDRRLRRAEDRSEW